MNCYKMLTHGMCRGYCAPETAAGTPSWIPLIDEESMRSCALTAVLDNLRQGSCQVMWIFGQKKSMTAFGTPAD